MFRKMFLMVLSAALFALLPAVVGAQSTGSQAPLGSKENPIKPTLVQTAVVSPTPTSKGKGKRGSKTNPISGRVHPRGTN